MFLFRLAVTTTTVAALLATAPVFGDSLPARLRGTITAISEGRITLNERDGRTYQLETGSGTAYADVVPSSLDEIKVNDYIGSAVKGTRDHLIAVEIVLVPEKMQPGRVGYYAWDPLPDTSAIETSGVSDTAMTKGFVSAVTTTTRAIIKTTMTNGTIVASSDGTAGLRTLTVNLVDDKAANILVSSAAPVVRFVPSDRSTISVGSAVVIWTQPNSQARLVAVGKGVTPPM